MSRDQHELFAQLAAYGYPLVEPAAPRDPEGLLERLARQREPRLVEGFAVVLLHALRERASLRWEKKEWNPQRELGTRTAERLAGLLAVSGLLFRLFGVERALQERVLRLLPKFPQGTETLQRLEAPVMKSEPVRVDGLTLSADRLKTTFRRYYLDADRPAAPEDRTRALELELLLSTLFTPRQKELLRKRASGASMTNTERTYFYRTVNKRLKALASEEVHQLARRLLKR